MTLSRNFLLSSITLFAAVFTRAAAPAVFAQTGPTADRSIERLGPFLEKVVREDKVPGLAIGVVAEGKVVYSRGIGTMRVGDATRPVTTQTLFHMASITKPFVATAVMQLQEQGKVDLDDPITKYLPYFRLDDPRYRSITVRQMLTHSSGMPDVADYRWDQPEYDDGALERYVRSLTDKKLRWQPGSKFAYSNMAYEVLGDLVTKVSGKSFEDYVEANILKPVGMKSSTLLVKKADPAKLAAGHTRANDGAVKPIAHYPYNRAHTPSSNLHSNVDDMARWMMVNLNRGELDGQRILRRSTYDLMWKPAVAIPSTGHHVGISWFLEESKGEHLVAHGGGDDGFLTYVCLCPDRKIGVVMMTTYDYGPPARRILDTTIATALGREVGK
jgi:CubicO group peptidase (beta-lactamase class C family)